MYSGVVISGLPGAGKSTLIRRLQEHTNWQVYAIGELLRERHRELYAHNEVSFDSWWPTVPLSELRDANNKLRDLVAKGSVIGDSRYVHYCGSALRIFLTADFETRIKRIGMNPRYTSYSIEQLADMTRRREYDEVQIGKNLWGKDYDYRDPMHYHLVLNTAKLSVEEEFELILKLIK